MVRGTNGSGKTSLLRVLAGFNRAETGSLSFRFGSEDWSNGPAQFGVGWLGHQNGLSEELNPVENLRFWLNSNQDQADVERVLAQVDMTDLQLQPVHTLSAGQRRRLGLARLLLGNHSLWLIDEPGANLDKNGSALVEALLEQHIKSAGCAIIASHEKLQPNVPTSYITLQAASAS